MNNLKCTTHFTATNKTEAVCCNFLQLWQVEKTYCSQKHQHKQTVDLLMLRLWKLNTIITGENTS